MFREPTQYWVVFITVGPISTLHDFLAREVMITVTQFSNSEINDTLACQVEIIGHFSIRLIDIMFMSKYFANLKFEHFIENAVTLTKWIKRIYLRNTNKVYLTFSGISLVSV